MSDIINYYQTIPELGIKGRMNTPEEFEKIGFPKKIGIDYRIDGVHKRDKVLDVGCNNGAFLIEAIKRGAGYIVGIDINPIWTQRAVDALTKVFPKWRTRGQIINDDAFSVLKTLGLGTRRFDFILCLSVCHLVDNPNELINLCVNALYPKGLLILEINDRLQTIPIKLPDGAKFFGKNKDNRSVWHIWK